jgi:hypothetical protein
MRSWRGNTAPVSGSWKMSFTTTLSMYTMCCTTRRGDEISVTYDASYICAVYDEEDGGEASGGEEEQCLGEAERIARLTLEEYRKLMAKWAEELGVQTEEELKKDGSVFTLTVRVVAPAGITPS